MIFVETGLVVMPFFPGDSLLFAAGAFLAVAGQSPLILIAVACLAAVGGDAATYAVGHSSLGQQIVRRGWINPRHMEETKSTFAWYGGATVTIARFVPIEQHDRPPLWPVSRRWKRGAFVAFNIAGGVLCCSALTLAGDWLGHIVWVREHLQWLSLIVIAVSVVPVGIQLVRARSKRGKGGP